MVQYLFNPVFIELFKNHLKQLSKNPSISSVKKNDINNYISNGVYSKSVTDEIRSFLSNRLATIGLSDVIIDNYINILASPNKVYIYPSRGLTYADKPMQATKIYNDMFDIMNVYNLILADLVTEQNVKDDIAVIQKNRIKQDQDNADIINKLAKDKKEELLNIKNNYEIIKQSKFTDIDSIAFINDLLGSNILDTIIDTRFEFRKYIEQMVISGNINKVFEFVSDMINIYNNNIAIIESVRNKELKQFELLDRASVLANIVTIGRMKTVGMLIVALKQIPATITSYTISEFINEMIKNFEEFILKDLYGEIYNIFTTKILFGNTASELIVKAEYLLDFYFGSDNKAKILNFANAAKEITNLVNLSVDDFIDTIPNKDELDISGQFANISSMVYLYLILANISKYDVKPFTDYTDGYTKVKLQVSESYESPIYSITIGDSAEIVLRVKPYPMDNYSDNDVYRLAKTSNIAEYITNIVSLLRDVKKTFTIKGDNKEDYGINKFEDPLYYNKLDVSFRDKIIKLKGQIKKMISPPLSSLKSGLKTKFIDFLKRKTISEIEYKSFIKECKKNNKEYLANMFQTQAEWSKYDKEPNLRNEMLKEKERQHKELLDIIKNPESEKNPQIIKKYESVKTNDKIVSSYFNKLEKSTSSAITKGLKKITGKTKKGVFVRVVIGSIIALALYFTLTFEKTYNAILELFNKFKSIFSLIGEEIGNYIIYDDDKKFLDFTELKEKMLNHVTNIYTDNEDKFEHGTYNKVFMKMLHDRVTGEIVKINTDDIIYFGNLKEIKGISNNNIYIKMIKDYFRKESLLGKVKKNNIPGMSIKNFDRSKAAKIQLEAREPDFKLKQQKEMPRIEDIELQLKLLRELDLANKEYNNINVIKYNNSFIFNNNHILTYKNDDVFNQWLSEINPQYITNTISKYKDSYIMDRICKYLIGFKHKPEIILTGLIYEYVTINKPVNKSKYEFKHITSNIQYSDMIKYLIMFVLSFFNLNINKLDNLTVKPNTSQDGYVDGMLKLKSFADPVETFDIKKTLPTITKNRYEKYSSVENIKTDYFQKEYYSYPIFLNNTYLSALYIDAIKQKEDVPFYIYLSKIEEIKDNIDLNNNGNIIIGNNWLLNYCVSCKIDDILDDILKYSSFNDDTEFDYTKLKENYFKHIQSNIYEQLIKFISPELYVKLYNKVNKDNNIKYNIRATSWSAFDEVDSYTKYMERMNGIIEKIGNIKIATGNVLYKKFMKGYLYDEQVKITGGDINVQLPL